MMDERASRRVVRGMVNALQGQLGTGGNCLHSISGPDEFGRVVVSGTIDLAALALVVETELRDRFRYG